MVSPHVKAGLDRQSDMGVLDKFKARSAVSSLTEEALYEFVASESYAHGVTCLLCNSAK